MELTLCITKRVATRPHTQKSEASGTFFSELCVIGEHVSGGVQRRRLPRTNRLHFT